LETQNYQETRDAISHDWIRFLDGIGLIPILVPNTLFDPSGFLVSLEPDLLMLTGGDDIGSTPDRDATEIKLLETALEANLPVIGICRGMQLINAKFGGVLSTIENHIACAHGVHLGNGWETFYGSEARVNSFHGLGVKKTNLAEGFKITATDPEGNIEGISHTSLPLAGVMWHPERQGAPEGDRELIQSFISHK